MRRGIFHRLKVLEILRNRYFHAQLQLPGGEYPTEYSIGAGKSAESGITALFREMQVGQNLAATGTGASSGCACGWTSGTSISQSQPSLMQACSVPSLVALLALHRHPAFRHG